MRLLLILGLLLVSCQSFSFAQDAEPARASEARRFDAFGDEEYSSLAARLDFFAQELNKDPQARAFVVAYRSRRDLPGLSSRLVYWLKSYLVHSRGIAADRVVGIDGGVAFCVAQELWIVPPTATIKPRDDAYEPFEDTDSTRLFDTAPYYGRDDLPESYGGHIAHSLEGFSDALRKQPRAKAYLVGYSVYRVDEFEETDERNRTTMHRKVVLGSRPEALKALAQTKERLVNEFKIPGNRIQLMFGGFRKTRTLELWIVPPGEHPPIPTPNAFPKSRK